MHKHKYRQRAKKNRWVVTNWKQYNEALVERGSLELWISQDAQSTWYAPKATTQGAPRIYSDGAIQTVLTLKNIFHLPLRQTEGFVSSVFHLTHISLAVPDFSTLSRRSSILSVALPKKNRKKTILVVDSTGAKVYGEGEWKVHKHGQSKHRTWRKIHIAIGEDGEIRAVDVTKNDNDDAAVVESILGQEEGRITALVGDGAYDTLKVYQSCLDKGIARILVPPRSSAKILHHGNKSAPAHPRDVNLRIIRKKGRSRWKEESGYHVRSTVEATMFRFKRIFGERLSAREWSRQVTEVRIRVALLNRMLYLGMPTTQKVLG